MTSTQNKLLNALSDALWHNTFSSIPPGVLDEAQLQAVDGLLVGEDLYTATRFIQYCYMEDELVELLSSHNIPMVIVKGISAAIYYPIPSARTFGDIDFIVPHRYFPATTALLESNGYIKTLNLRTKIGTAVIPKMDTTLSCITGSPTLTLISNVISGWHQEQNASPHR